MCDVSQGGHFYVRKEEVVCIEIYTPMSKRELSQRKLEEYHKIERVINLGRANPIWFVEEFFGIKLLDYQKWTFMESWARPFILWLECRGAGKTTLSSVFLMAKMLLIPSYKVYISTNSAQQSMEVFKKIEDITLQRIPSFRTCTDLFAAEVARSANSETGFLHNPAGHSFRLYNNSELVTLSTNVEAIRGKRGSVFYDEAAWQSKEQMAATEPYIAVDADSGLGVDRVRRYDPKQMPLQLIYASSAGDVESPFFEKYKNFAKKMYLGHPDYFVCDLNIDTIFQCSTVDGGENRPQLSRSQVEKMIDEDPDAAARELYNKFIRGAGENAVMKMETLLKNSEVYCPVLRNDTGKRKFIFCYDPARNFDGSILAIFELIYDNKVGYRMKLVRMISMVDRETRNKTPLPMPDQLEIIKKLMLDYNGDRAAEWENIELYIDSGAGGGGISAVADSLMEDWTDSFGGVHRGVIDPVHKQYETSRKKYGNAMPIVHLVDPKGFKRVIYDALEKMTKLNLITFPEYDGKDFLLLADKDGAAREYKLSAEEQESLIQCNLAKTELLYMTRYDTPNGGVQYELSKDKKHTMHDDRAYACALGAYALAIKRRCDLLRVERPSINLDKITALARAPKLYERG